MGLLLLSVDMLAQKLYKAGKITDLCEDAGFFERLTKIEKQWPGAGILLHKFGILGKPLQDLWSNERLLNVVEQLMGPHIAGHPVWNLRCKTPNNEAAVVPFHQDAGYLGEDSYTVMQPTAWIPLLDATEENGCMQIVRNGHKTGRIATHECCAGNTWYVMLDDEEMEKTLEVDLEKDKLICPVPLGGMLLFSNILPHQSLTNKSDKIRWSLDLRWQRPDLPNGFYGLKDNVLMRTPDNPHHKIDWETFNAVNRSTVQSLQQEEDEFDTTITGPWMTKWKMVHHNRHTDRFETAPGNWTKA